MEARNDGEAGSPLWTRDSPLTKRFIRLFYGIMNTYPEHLYLFYGDRSRVVVSEFGPTSPPVTQTADTQIKVRELLKTVHQGVRVTVKTAIPQISVEEGVLLLVSGIFTKTSSTSNTEEDHCFTQSLMLAPQKQGYYVLTDTLHIMKGGDDKSTDTPFRWMEEEQANSQCFSFYPQINSILSKPNTEQTTKSNNGLSSEAEPCEGPSEAKPLPDGIRKPTSKDTQDNGRPQAKDEDVNKPNKVKTTSVPKSIVPPRKTQPPSHRRIHTNPRLTIPVGGGQIADTTPMNYIVGVPNPGPIRRPKHLPSSSNPPLMPVPPGKGVFIARLPFGIQPEEVVRIFSIFGPIANGADGIQVRDGRNGCYAFVTFESAASAQAAIQNGAVVQGKRVFVEPRNPSHVENADPGFVSMHVGMPTSCVLAPPPPPPPSALQFHQISNIAPCVRRRAN